MRFRRCFISPAVGGQSVTHLWSAPRQWWVAGSLQPSSSASRFSRRSRPDPRAAPQTGEELHKHTEHRNNKHNSGWHWWFVELSFYSRITVWSLRPGFLQEGRKKSQVLSGTAEYFTPQPNVYVFKAAFTQQILIPSSDLLSISFFFDRLLNIASRSVFRAAQNIIRA